MILDTNAYTAENRAARREKARNQAIECVGVVAAWEAEPYIKKTLRYPLRPYFKKTINSVTGVDYRQYLDKAIEQNDLKDKLKITNLTPQTADEVKRTLGLKLTKPKGLFKVLAHVFRLPINGNIATFNATMNGKNAFFYPKGNTVVCNFEKFGAPVFHEIAHKLNESSKNPIVKTLADIRSPLAFLGPLAISAFAVFNNPPKNEKEKKTPEGFIKNNCGLLATAAMLPLTIEETIANVKGTKIAEKAGVTGDMLKKVKNVHKMSIISYCTAAIATGVAVHCASKIRDAICSKKTNSK